MNPFSRSRAVTASLLALLLAAPLAAQDKPAGDKPASADKPAEEAKPAEPSEPAPVVTAHSLVVNGKSLSYHATAGYLVLKSEGEKDADDDKEPDFKDDLSPKAKVFFIAYTLDGAGEPGTRPVTFCFNGGPGSSSIWLHMAANAPRRAKLSDEGEAPPPPYQLVDNESTWLDSTDLVFIDPVSTGFSRPMPGQSAKQFHGLQEDIASVGEFIRLWTTRNERWLSPKFVLGESYGTTRAAGLSDYLQDRYGLYLNGIVLVSSVLDFRTLIFSAQNDAPCIAFLPAYAATAWYHNRLAPELQSRSLEDVCTLAREYAGGEYTLALSRGDTLGREDSQLVATQLERLTGLPAAWWQQRHLRVSDDLFFTALLKEQGRIVGRFDSRFTGLRYEPGTERGEWDPSGEAVFGPLTAAFNDYVRRELKYESDLSYETLTNVWPWNFGDAIEGFPNTAEAMRRAMIRNPYLKIWVTAAYYDLATPFFGAEQSVAALNLDPAVRRNLRFSYYESGHMHYIHAASRAKFKTDWESFLHDAVTQETVKSAARQR